MVDWEAIHKARDWGKIPDQYLGAFICSQLKSGELSPDSRVLDIGCGLGANATFFNCLGDVYLGLDNYTGIDISESAVFKCKARFLQNERLKFIQSPFLEYDSEEKFDLIIDSFALAYEPNRFKALTKVNKMLSKHGVYWGLWPCSSNFDAPRLSINDVISTFVACFASRDYGQRTHNTYSWCELIGKK